MNNNTDLGKNFWNERYRSNQTGWDLGQVSSPLKAYIDQLTDKNLRILIPGCGNSYEAEYLMAEGFTNVTVIDIAPELVKRLKSKFRSNQNITIILGDFFSHKAEYDLVLEQTFFCALDPKLRKNYAEAMKSLLVKGGKLAGVLFDTHFEKQGPPFGGSALEYHSLFEKIFELKIFEPCNNSFPKRAGSELFVVMVKK